MQKRYATSALHMGHGKETKRGRPKGKMKNKEIQ
jgi:hypothetical protein